MSQASAIITDPEELRYSAYDALVSRTIGESLERHYPGRGWVVYSDTEQGIAKFGMNSISDRYHMVVHTNTTSWPDLERKVMRLAGEMLERFHLTRGRMVEGQVESLKRNPLTGEVFGAEKGELEK